MGKALFKKILIANRSEIAVRVIAAARSLGISTVAVYSDADQNAKHRRLADESVHIGAASPRESYLNIEKIINAAREHGCDAIHPGYGFLAENPDFAHRCAKEKIIFIGPPAGAILLLGNKVESRLKMEQAQVPLIPGMKSSSDDLNEFIKAADEAGYPVIIKAAAGGGGKGMRVVNQAGELEEAVAAAKREAKSAFDDDAVYLEKYIVDPRHIEFQILADTHGHTIHVFERECSIQRRHQKIIEETPSVALDDALRTRMGADAVKVAETAGYINAGTVEFLLDESGHYYFLEMNTRIQVEHPITEMVTGTDLVVEQIRIAAGLPISDTFTKLQQHGHAIECRIYAEDGENDFMPSTGRVLYYHEPSGPGVRVDSGVEKNSMVTIDYDPILAKLIVHAPDRPTAINKMINALNEYKILGLKTSKRFMINVLNHEQFQKGKTLTNFIERHMGQRKEHNEACRSMAVAAAAAYSTDDGRASLSGLRPEAVSPWSTLGLWQIGASIDE